MAMNSWEIIRAIMAIRAIRVRVRARVSIRVNPNPNPNSSPNPNSPNSPNNFCGLTGKNLKYTLKEETFAVSRFLAKSAKVYSREIFQKTSSAKVSSSKIF